MTCHVREILRILFSEISLFSGCTGSVAACPHAKPAILPHSLAGHPRQHLTLLLLTLKSSKTRQLQNFVLFCTIHTLLSWGLADVAFTSQLQHGLHLVQFSLVVLHVLDEGASVGCRCRKISSSSYWLGEGGGGDKLLKVTPGKHSVGMGQQAGGPCCLVWGVVGARNTRESVSFRSELWEVEYLLHGTTQCHTIVMDPRQQVIPPITPLRTSGSSPYNPKNELPRE